MPAERVLPDIAASLGIPNGLRRSKLKRLETFRIQDTGSSTSDTSPISEIRTRYSNLLEHGYEQILPFLQSRKFVRYMTDLRTPGPANDHIFAAAESGDVNTFLFGVRHADQMREIDDTYHALNTSTTKPAISEPARALFTERIEEVWRTVADTTDRSLWRQFLLAQFPAVYNGTIAIADPQEYLGYAQREYERMKGFVESSNPKQFKYLATYLHDSREHKNGGSIAAIFDADVRQGKFDRFYHYRKLRDLSTSKKNAERSQHRRETPAYLNQALSYGVEGFENGTLTFEELAQLPFILARSDRAAGQITADSTIDSALVYWLKELKNGTITLDAYTHLPLTLVTFAREAGQLTADLPPHHPANTHVNRLLRNNVMATTPDVPLQLLANGVLPTDSLISLMQTEGEEGLATLAALKQATREGRFDPNNTAQRDIEYLNYLKMLKPPYSDASLHTFSTVPFLAEKTQVTELTINEVGQARTAAYEAAKVYWLIRESTAKGKNALVVGNQRYGKHYVTDPLRPYLDELDGISFVDTWARSTPYTFTNTLIIDDLFPPDIEQSIKQGDKDIWIIDGTKEAMDIHTNIPRLPRSNFAFLNWFLAYNAAIGNVDPRFKDHVSQLLRNDNFIKLMQRLGKNNNGIPYTITMWTPMAEDNQQQINIGSHQYGYTKPSSNESNPQIILVNPVIIPDREKTPWFPDELNRNSRGYFDDPDEIVKTKSNIVFTRFGITNLINGKTEDQYVQQVQDVMGDTMDEMLSIASPFR